MNTLLSVAAIFVATFVLDFVWAKYTRAVADNAPLRASTYAVGTIVLSGVSAIGYTSNYWLLIPAGAGCFVGTFVAVRREKMKTP